MQEQRIEPNSENMAHSSGIVSIPEDLRETWERAMKYQPVPVAVGSIDDIKDLIWISEKTPKIDVQIYFYTDPKEPDSIQAISWNPNTQFDSQGMQKHILSSTWSIPCYHQMEGYRRACLQYYPEYDRLMVDDMLMTDILIIKHLLSIMVNGEEMFLHRNQLDGSLTGDTLQEIKKLHAGLYDQIYTQYRYNACLV